MLEAAGYKVDTAADGSQALAKLKADKYDMLIADINMPVMDGVELLKRTKETFPELPVIFVTGFGRDKIIVQAMKDGLSDFLQKPFRMDDVTSTIKRYL